jgi:hypothetical protein
MFAEDQGPGETAVGFTDQFVEAGIAKLDEVFGAGYAKENPAALAAYIATCASNLNAFMTAATAVEDLALEDALAAFEEDLLEQPAPPRKPKGKRR